MRIVAFFVSMVTGAVAQPAWIVPYPETEQGGNSLSYTALAPRSAAVAHYEKELKKAEIPAQSSFDGVGSSIRASKGDIICVIRISERSSATSRVETKCADQTVNVIPEPKPPVLPPGVHQIDYYVNGCTEASLTYSNASGGTEQNPVRCPEHFGFLARTGAFVYLSAQNQGKRGEVIVEIAVDRRVVQRARSGEMYGIATVSGRVP